MGARGLVASGALLLAFSFAGCQGSIQLPSELEPPDAGPIVLPADGGAQDGGAPDSGAADAGVRDAINPNFPGYRLVFEDEFNGPAIDEHKWYIGEGPNWDAVFSRDAVTVANGIARITTYTEGGAHRTGYLSTTPTEFSYGYFEARVWLSGAPGMACSFWTNPDTFSKYPGDPARAGVELDIFEHRFIDDNGQNLWDHAAISVHWYTSEQRVGTATALLPLADRGRIQGTWRTFGVLWEPAGYTFYAEDKPIWKADAPLSGAPAPVKLACGVWDHSWAGEIPVGGYGSRDTSKAGMAIDWVRIWQRK